jgi:hypothetical protein
VCLGLAILAIAMGVLVGSLFSALRISQASEATACANQALRGVLERLNAMTVEDVFAICNGEPADDIVGRSSADYLMLEEGLMHDVHGAPLAISVAFPCPDGQPGVLREDLDLPALGMPRDLNGDGVIDAGDHSGDFELLPALLTLEWTGPSGLQRVQLATLLRNP